MSTSSVLHSAANKLYQYVFPIYRLLYAAYKTRADRAERELLKQILFPGAVVVDVVLTLEFIPNFSPAVLARPGWFILSNLRRTISGGCVLPHVIFQMSGSLKLRSESVAASLSFTFPIS